jgi:GNAT superfamily N-acetyltransferase/predicted enzyme related to lactoylglutathione lyase
MIFKGSVPILYSSDIRRSIEYYKHVLGFADSWEWDDPPTFGGVSKDLVQLFFCKESQGNPGTWIAINVDDVNALYESIKLKGGKILSAPEDKEWGLREMLVQDPDQHIIRFGQHSSYQHGKSDSLPENIRIVDRLPTPDEFELLVNAVGWKQQPRERTITVLEAPLYGAVAIEDISNRIAGCVLLLGDGASFYYVKDMMVDPDYQGRHVGAALMQQLNKWLDENGAPNALVGLYTGENLAPFYREFGFRESFGMCRRIAARD